MPDSISKGSRVVVAVCVLACGSTAFGQIGAAAKKKKQTTSSKCSSSIRPARQKSKPILLPCGPDRTLANAATFSDPNTVVVGVLLDENGKILSARPVSGDPALHEKAVRAVREMKFTPKRLAGRPVKTELNVKVVIDSKSSQTISTISRNVTGGPSVKRPRVFRRKAHRASVTDVITFSSDELWKRVIERQPVRRPSLLGKNDLQGIVTIQVLIDRRGRVVSARGLAGTSSSVASHIRSLRKWKFQPYKVNNELKAMTGPLSLRYDFQDEDDEEPTFCEQKLGEARWYESGDDPRAEGEYQRVISEVGYQCPEAFRGYGWYLSGNLRFREAAKNFQTYLNLTPVSERRLDPEDVTESLQIAELKERVDAAAKPELDDLLKLTHELIRSGRRRGFDALPYAEKAVELYPNSAVALLSLANTIEYKPSGYRSPGDRQRVLEFLNRAVEVEPNNPVPYSTRGLYYIDVFRQNERQRPEEAEKDFRMALSLSNDADADAWKGMGYLHLLRGEKREALAAFRKHVNLTKNPSYDVNEQIEILERFPR